MRFFALFTVALGLCVARNSFGVAILDSDNRSVTAHLNATVSPSAPFVNFDVSSRWVGPPPGTEFAEAIASQNSVVTPEHFAGYMRVEVQGRDTATGFSIFDVNFHLSEAQRYTLLFHVSAQNQLSHTDYAVNLAGLLVQDLHNFEGASFDFNRSGVLEPGDYRMLIILNGHQLHGEFSTPRASSISSELSLDLMPLSSVPDQGSTFWLLSLSLASVLLGVHGCKLYMPSQGSGS